MAALIAMGLSAQPAAAAPAETPITLTVAGGSLTISAPTAMSDLGTRDSASNGVLSGQLGQVRVSDERGGGTGEGWVASVISTDFTTPTGPPIPASAVGYRVGTISQDGTATLTAHNPTDLSRLAPAVTADEIAGNNAATWTPTISVTVPAGAVSGVYAATITHSVA